MPTKDSSIDLTSLSSQYEGMNVRTERPATLEERERGLEIWGGEGVVDSFFIEDGLPWVLMDWGMGWIITPCTKIILLGGEDPIYPPEPDEEDEGDMLGIER